MSARGDCLREELHDDEREEAAAREALQEDHGPLRRAPQQPAGVAAVLCQGVALRLSLYHYCTLVNGLHGCALAARQNSECSL